MIILKMKSTTMMRMRKMLTIFEHMTLTTRKSTLLRSSGLRKKIHEDRQGRRGLKYA